MADHKDPCDLHSRPGLLDAQRALDAAWDDLEIYRKKVDADRRASATTTDGGVRPWSEEENREFAQRLDMVKAASEARAKAMAAADLKSTYQVETELRAHAREDPPPTV
jgi:hypothetical protein